MRIHSRQIKIFCIILALSLLIACSRGGKKSVSQEGTTQYDTKADIFTEDKIKANQSMEIQPGEPGAGEVGIQKIAMTYNLEMQTKEFEKTQQEIESTVFKHKGFIEYSEIRHNDYYSSGTQYAHWIFKIPKEVSGNALEEFKTFGHLVRMQQQGENLTSAYQDTQSKIELYQMKEERLKALLSKAEKMEDIIKLEESITDTIYQKDNLNKALKGMDKRVDYVTVELSLTEVRDYTEPKTEMISFGQRVLIAFKEMGNNIVYGLQNLILGIIYWLPLLIILIIIVFIVKRFRRGCPLKKKTCFWKKKKETVEEKTVKEEEQNREDE